MCCQYPTYQGSHSYQGFHGCCCQFPRRFVSREEERERLKKYREQLKKELVGLEEKLKELD